MKVRSVFVCQQCGAKSPKWVGKCPECGGWNTMVETQEELKIQSSKFKVQKAAAKPQKLSEIKLSKKPRLSSGISELDRVLGGGIVPGSVILIAGEPGIGKSTLLLELVAKTSVSADWRAGLYISGEESLSQIKLRAERLGIKTDNLLFLAETNVDVVTATIEQLNSQTIKQLIVIVDSIQTLYTDDLMGTPGSVGQVRECANRLLKIAKSNDIPLFLIGHITKEGVIAGPKVLEHLVDTVLYLEGERFGTARLLRAIKNRFGPTDEVGVFQMTDKGMEPVANPSALFLAQKAGKTPGSVVVATLEGTRPLLVEIQALVVSSQLAVSRRVSQGIDYNRLQMIVAVLTKILRLPLGGFDIYVNVTGGLKIEEPAADLGVALAIYSSFKNLCLPPKTVCWGELGLLGETREVGKNHQREKEARRLGFTNIISSKNYPSINQVVKVFHNS